jgi:ATP-dependent DNA ligase
MLPANTVVDGEVVALDDSGHPDFHALQHFKASASRIHYFVFDLLILQGRDLMNMPLTKCRDRVFGMDRGRPASPLQIHPPGRQEPM